VTTSVSGQQDELSKYFMGLMSAIEKQNSMMRSMIVPKTPIDAGSFLDEYLSAASSPLIMQLGIDRPALVTHLLFAINPVGAATLTIGPASGTMRTIPIVNYGDNMIECLNVAMIVRPGDIITLTSAGATQLFVELMGKVLSGTDWAQI